MSRYRRSVFFTGDRDANEKDITDILARCKIPYCLMPPTAGFDLLVFAPYVELWEIKNPLRKWTLTKAEQIMKSYCEDYGIPYRVIETQEQAIKIVEERNTK